MVALAHNGTLVLLKKKKKKNKLLKNHCSIWNPLKNKYRRHDICLRKAVSKKSISEIFRNDSNYVRQAKRKAIQEKTSAPSCERLSPTAVFLA